MSSRWADVDCVMPPAPELEDRIIRTKEMVLAGGELPTVATVDVLDLRTFSLITGRPTKTRADTFLTPTVEKAPVTGTRRVLVLLVDFSDKAATKPQSHYNNLLFSSGTYPTGSMRDFYAEASYGKLNVIGAVSGQGGPTAGWYRAPKPKSYYTNSNFGFGAYPQNAQKLAEDVIDLADPYVNFATYDNDGDGVVEAVVIIAAGSGGEATGNKSDIWSHKWGLSSPKIKDGVKIQTYFMAPEDGRVGVMAHELGHLLMAWPDLYDTDYSSAGTGRWDLMAGGSWNNGGDTPAHPVAYLKAKSGWIAPSPIFNAELNVTILPYATSPQVYKLPVGTSASKEYFLVSNRQQTKFDAHMPGEGCVIEHVDENVMNNTNELHYLVDIEQCDGKLDLNKNANRGDSTDPFPCPTNSSFAATTTPSSKAYDGSDPKISVKNITRVGDNITATINVGGAAAKAWHYNKKILNTYALTHPQYALGYVEGLGWRRVTTGTADGVTNVFAACCDAQANGRLVHVEVDGSNLYRVMVT